MIKRGMLEVITGPMFSGKTETLIRLIRRSRYANQDVLLFKPATDTRQKHICSRNGHEEDAIEIEKARDIIGHLRPGVAVVGIEEIQFIDEELIEVILELCKNGIRVLACGLDRDYLGQPFAQTSKLLGYADKRHTLTAICMVDGCQNEAGYTHRLSGGGDRIVVGDESYQAHCKHHFTPNTSL
jgi:thymidine kinase